MTKATNAVLERHTLPITQLIPNGAREDLRLNDHFVNSIRENGIKVRLAVTPTGGPDDPYKILMGDRRHGAAQLAGLTEVPVYVVDPALREAGEEYIEQLIENDEKGREPLTELEKADALFRAEEAGMSRATLARRTGRTKAEVTKAVTAAKSLSPATRRTLAEAGDYEWTTDVLAALGEFDDDPEAVERLLTARESGYFDHQVTREKAERARCAARIARIAELAATNVTLVEDADDLPDTAEFLEHLRTPEGLELSPEGHATCPGHLAVWDDDAEDPAATAYVCADPAAHSHQDTRASEQEELPDAQPTDSTAPESSRAQSTAADDLPYKLKTEGNNAYRAARTTRREWLRTELLSRKTAPKALAPFVTEQLLTCPKPVQSWAGDVSRVALLAELLGQDKETAAQRADWVGANATPGRLMLFNFAVIAACYEKRMDQVQTWRHDRPQYDTEDIRADARVFLAFLGTIGYPLAPIEQAIISGEPYTLADADEDAPADEEPEEAADAA